MDRVRFKLLKRKKTNNNNNNNNNNTTYNNGVDKFDFRLFNVTNRETSQGNAPLPPGNTNSACTGPFRYL